jgi:hypothetical protein
MTRAGARSGPDDGGVYTQPLGDGDAGLPQGSANRQPPIVTRVTVRRHRHALQRRTL